MIGKSLLTKIGCGSSQRSMGTVAFKTFGKTASVLEYSKASGVSTEPATGQVKISIKAAQVSTEDVRMIRGVSLTNKTTGVAGTTGVGSVTAVGSGVSGVKVGDSVLAIGSGLWTDSVTLPASSVFKVSSSIPVEEAANLPAAVSAYIILKSVPLSAGDSVLQSSADSAIDLGVSQVGKALGYNVTSTSDKPVKLAVSSSTGKAAHTLIKSLAHGGVLVSYNGVKDSEDGVAAPVSSSIFDDVSISGFDLGTYAASNSSGISEAVTAVCGLYDSKKITLKSKVYPQAEFASAVTIAESTGGPAVIKL